MNKTRVYVEESAVATKYYAQIQKSFLGIKYWRNVSTWLNKIESKSHWTVGNIYNMNAEEGNRNYAEAVCEEVVRRLKKKEDKLKHKKTKKVWSYLFPEDV